jgi:hypothetical protein
MLKSYSRCNDRSKCAYIGLGAVLACLAVAYGLWAADGYKSTVTMLDGMHYDHNPWTKTN